MHRCKLQANHTGSTLYTYIYIYIYGEREREIYIYIYIYISNISTVTEWGSIQGLSEAALDAQSSTPNRGQTHRASPKPQQALITAENRRHHHHHHHHHRHHHHHHRQKKKKSPLHGTPGSLPELAGFRDSRGASF